MITQSQIARHLGISQSAVACALHPTLHRHINAEKRQLILATATQMGYVPHHAARRLARTRSRHRLTSFDQVGLIYLADANNELDPGCLAMMRGAEHELSRLHASLTFIRVGEPGDWAKVDRLSRAGGLDGWLVYGRVNDEVPDRLKPGKLPFVILGDHGCTQSVFSVATDNGSVGRLVVQHLASLGHRCIAYLRCDLKYLYQQQVLEGFRAALREMGLDEDNRLIGRQPAVEDVPGWYHQWLRGSDLRPTALFVLESDGTAELGFLRQARMEVPREISLVGCEVVSQAASDWNPTRVEFSMGEVGRQGALLLRRLVSEPGLAAHEVKIPPMWKPGCSTSPPSPTGTEGTLGSR